MRLTGCLLILIAAAAVPARAERTASVNLCADELLLKLADPENIAAVTRIRGDEAGEEILAAHPAIRRIGGEAEELIGLGASHVLTGPAPDPASAALYRRLGIRVTAIPVPADLESMAHTIRLAADAVGEPERGEALIARYRAILDAPAPEPDAPRALFWDAGGHTAGAGTFEDGVLRAAGLRNAAAAAGIEGHAWLSVEEMIFLKPDILVIRYGRRRDGAAWDGVFHPAIESALPAMKKIFLPRAALACGGPAAFETILKLRKDTAHA